MPKTVFEDTPPLGTVVSAAFLNAVNNHRHTGENVDGAGALDYAASSGSANAYELTLSPALAAHIAGMPIVMKANFANTGAATININSLGAVAIKRIDGTDLQAGDIVNGSLIMLIHDGTYYQSICLASQAVAPCSSVRQTVQAGPVSSVGLPTFLPASASGLNLVSQNINPAAALVVSAAAGYGAAGEVNYIGKATDNITWASLVNSATLYLYVTISGGILTPGFTGLPPVYQWGGTPSVVSGQATYNIQEGKMYLGNGSSAEQVNLVFIGEAVTSGGNIASTTMYAYNGRYNSGYTATLPGDSTVIAKNHNIGTSAVIGGFRIKCLTAEQNYSIGDVTTVSIEGTVSDSSNLNLTLTSKVIQIVSGNNVNFQVQNKTGGGIIGVTEANWAYELYARREF